MNAYVYMALPITMGGWSMACMLQLHTEYYLSSFAYSTTVIQSVEKSGHLVTTEAEVK